MWQRHSPLLLPLSHWGKEGHYITHWIFGHLIEWENMQVYKWDLAQQDVQMRLCFYRVQQMKNSSLFRVHLKGTVHPENKEYFFFSAYLQCYLFKSFFLDCLGVSCHSFGHYSQRAFSKILWDYIALGLWCWQHQKGNTLKVNSNVSWQKSWPRNPQTFLSNFKLWAPQAECNKVPLYLWEGRHLYGRHLWN